MLDEQSEFFKQCRNVTTHLTALMERTANGESLDSGELLNNFSTAVEELSVAGEELNAQAAELDAMRDELAAQKRHYQELFEEAPEGYLVTRPDGAISEFNRAAARMLHISKKHLCGKPFQVFVASGDRKSFRQRLAIFKESAVHRDSWEVLLQPREKEPFYALLTVRKAFENGANLSELHWLIHDINERRAHEQQRELLLRRLVDAHEEERTKLARELHDHMAQHITALIVGLQAIKAHVPALSSSSIDNLQCIAKEIGQAVHQIATQLRPPALDDLGLATAVANYAEDWSQSTGIPTGIHCLEFSDTLATLSSEVKIAVYRIVQQALTNVLAHARASYVSVIVEQRCDELLAIVEDNGIGFDVGVCKNINAQQQLGLIGMRERATSLGGTLEIESEPGRGTTVFVRIPLNSVLVRGNQEVDHA